MRPYQTCVASHASGLFCSSELTEPRPARDFFKLQHESTWAKVRNSAMRGSRCVFALLNGQVFVGRPLSCRFGVDFRVFRAEDDLGVHLVARSHVATDRVLAGALSLGPLRCRGSQWCSGQAIACLSSWSATTSRTRLSFRRQAPLCWHVSLFAVTQGGSFQKRPKMVGGGAYFVVRQLQHKNKLTVEGFSCCDLKQSCVTRKTVVQNITASVVSFVGPN